MLAPAAISFLMSGAWPLNAAPIKGVTPAILARLTSAPARIVSKLIAAGAKLDPLDRVKKNAAIYAAGSGCGACLAELLRAGTPVNARLDNEETLLMWASGYGHESAVNFLLQQGADRGLKDNRGKTAADIARDGNFTAVIKLLEKI